MRGRAIIPLALGLCIGLVAVKFGLDALKHAQGSHPKTQAVTVVQALRDIRATELITPEMIEAVEAIPNRFIPEQERISDAATFAKSNNPRVAAKGIPQGMPILASMLAPEGTAPGMVGRIPPGFRASSVKIDEVSGVAYQIKPGDWVDVIAVIELEAGGRKKETMAEVILQHVQVAAVGKTSEGSGDTAESSAKGRGAKSATLFVKETDVPKLHLAGTKGKLTLALRGEDAQTTDENAVAKFSEVFRTAGFPEPAVEPAESPTAPPVERNTKAMTAISTAHDVTITHGADGSGGGDREEQVTFENANSRKVVQRQAPMQRGGRRPGQAAGHGANPPAQPADQGQTTATENDQDAGEWEAN